MEWYLPGLAERALPILCVLVAAFLQSITGFGLVIVAAPLLMLFYDPKLVIPAMILLATCGNTVQSVLLWRDAKKSLLLFLIAGSILGQPLGVLVYRALPSDALKIFISAAVLLALALMSIRHPIFKETHANSARAGFAAGFMATTTGMAGPPIAMYFAGIRLPAREIRATSITLFFLSNLVSLASFAGGGVDLAPAAHEFIYLLPGLALGIALGHLLFKYIPTQMIGRLIFLLLYAACFYTIWGAVKNLI